MNRRDFLAGALASATMAPPFSAQQLSAPNFRLVDVTSKAGIQFRHNSVAYGDKFLPETLGSGCAFLDYDRDGWQDILLVNGMDWPGHKRKRTTLSLYRNNRNGTFSDVTRSAGLDVEMYGMGVAVGDYNNDGFPDILITCVGQNRLFRNTGKGTFVDVTRSSGLGGREGFSTSAIWFDYDRDGLLDLFVCNYVKWSQEFDVFCNLDGQHKSYCTPEAYRGETCWLFHNRGDGTFEDVTATSGILDTSSKSLGVAMLDYDRDGWPDLLVANDTQPNKLYCNLCVFVDTDLDGNLDLVVVNGHIDDTVRFSNYGLRAAAPSFPQRRNGTFRDVASGTGNDFGIRRVGRGLAYADFDRDGDADILVTTNNGPAVLFRNDQLPGRRSIRFHLVGTKSNRDAIGAMVRVSAGGVTQSRLVKGGSSYLSQSELPVTFGLGKREKIDLVVIEWPSGQTEEYKNLAAGRTYDCVESKGITPLTGF